MLVGRYFAQNRNIIRLFTQAYAIDGRKKSTEVFRRAHSGTQFGERSNRRVPFSQCAGPEAGVEHRWRRCP